MSFTAAAPPPTPAPPAARDILDACFGEFRSRVTLLARRSFEQSGDLFEGNSFVSQVDVDQFKSERGAWLTSFDAALRELYERRLSGVKRKGRRPDFDASLGSLRVLTAFDHEKQAALTRATALVERLTRTELAALDRRIEVLLPEQQRNDVDNPFAPAYLLDAIGVTSRTVYPNARIWRAVMERLVEDFAPALPKLYIALNRTLADRGVLPEIKAELRARSELRPDDDRDLISTFGRMLGETPAANVDVPATLSEPNQPAAFNFRDGGDLRRSAATSPDVARALASPAILRGLHALAGIAAQQGAAAATSNASATASPPGSGAALAADGGAGPAGDFPDLDPMMALGSSTPLFNTLGHWQHLDLPAALAGTLPPADGGGTASVPLNLVPYIRAAVADQVDNPGDRITMDVIGLLFDYVFGDPSIPAEFRQLFGRMQVPVVKAALLDRGFFTDRKHPARRLLDRLAEGAVGATSDPDYRDAFESVAGSIVDRVCIDFGIDVAVFDRADRELAAFLERDRSATATAAEQDVVKALAAEEGEADRSHVRAFVRDRLTGLDLPFEVRSFAETVWADYLTTLRTSGGEDGAGWTSAVSTLDELLWSIVAKERTGQKARLTRMIPTLIGALRQGCIAVGAPAARTKPFFDALYPLHIAALRPPATETAPSSPPGAPAAAEPAPAAATPRSSVPDNLHDFVNDMVVGTWLAFVGDDGVTVNARLAWASPLRTKYLFTSRSRRHAFVHSPEELSWALGAGRARVIVEPVPLFDRAVSTALDTLAAARPPEPPGPPGPPGPASAAA
jgi:hypothetical protein